VYLNGIIEGFNDKNTNGTTILTIGKNNMIFSDAISRITIRTIQMHPHQGGNDNTTVNFSLSFIFQTSP